MTNLSVVCWNILYDKQQFFRAAPQASRRESITTSLASLSLELDIVGLLEVEDSEQTGHHGKRIAQTLTGSDGHWTTNEQAQEDLGMFGKVVSGINVVNLPGGRTMVTTELDRVTVVLVHFTHDDWSDKLRIGQASHVIRYMAGYDKAILMGDFNSAPWQRSRKVIENAGFSSVFQVLGRKRPPTILVEKYRKRLPLKYRLATKYGFSPDDIYVRGLSVNDAGVFEGDSDHRGVWADIQIP